MLIVRFHYFQISSDPYQNKRLIVVEATTHARDWLAGTTALHLINEVSYLHAGVFLPFSRGRISAPFPIKNSHLFPFTMFCFPVKKSVVVFFVFFYFFRDTMGNNNPYKNDT